MTANAYFTLPKVLRRLYEGPLGDYVDLYAAQLLREGHCYQSGRRCIRIVGDFSQWLGRKHFNISDVDESLVVQYLHTEFVRALRKSCLGIWALTSKRFRMTTIGRFS